MTRTRQQQLELAKIVRNFSVIRGAALLVGTVSEDLTGQLSLHEFETGSQHARGRDCYASEYQRRPVLQYVIAADVALDRSTEVPRLI